MALGSTQPLTEKREHAVAHWLRHCAISRKVTGSIPDGVIRIFYLNNYSGPNMVLGSTQPVTEKRGHAVAHFVKELCYKPEGHRFDSRWCH